MAQLGLVFPEQESQYPSMGQDLYRGDQSVRTLFADTGAALGQEMASRRFEGAQETSDLTVNTQISVLRADLAGWRIFPGRVTAAPLVMVGHSLGEYATLHAAGAVDLRDVLPLVRKRACYREEAVPAGEGAMAAVIGLPCEAVEALCTQSEDEGCTVDLAIEHAPRAVCRLRSCTGRGKGYRNRGPEKRRSCHSARHQCPLPPPPPAGGG